MTTSKSTPATQSSSADAFSVESIAAIANELYRSDVGNSASTLGLEVPAAGGLGGPSAVGNPDVFVGPAGIAADAAAGYGGVDGIPVLDQYSDIDLTDITSLLSPVASVESVESAGESSPGVDGVAQQVPTTVDDFASLAAEFARQLPDADLIAKGISSHPTTTEEAVDYVAGDHPFLESRYEFLSTQAGLSGAPAGADLRDATGDLASVGLSFDGVVGGLDLTAYGIDSQSPESLESGFGALEAATGTGLVVPGANGVSADSPSTNAEQADGDEDGYAPALGPTSATRTEGFNIERIRNDFPILRERVHGHRLVWLDNGATTQKPQSVIDRISYFYEHENSNVHRTAHTLAGRSTDAYEGAREKIRRFLNASSADEIIYVRGATEGMNLLANTFGEQNVGEGDEILISHLEHHANIVPWQMLCARKGARLKVAPVDDTGQIILSEFERLITPRTKLISFTQVSNALGTITPAAEMIEIAHRHGVPVVLDGAQGVLHMRVDVQTLQPDFYVFSGHKMFGPTGIGAVYGRMDHLKKMPPWQGGGNMIDCVQFDRTTYQEPPWRFEAGTGNIADAVGLGAAVDYINDVGIENIAAHEHQLLEYGTAELLTIPGLRIIGTASNKAAVMSFVLDGHDPDEVGSYLDQQGIAVRAGHHCAQPILRRFGVTATVRPSLALYNTHDDIDRLVEALRRLTGGRER